MKEVKLNSKTDKGFVTIAEIVPPLDRQWYILSPTTNKGWISVLLSDHHTVATAIRPGSVFAIDVSYVGKIEVNLSNLGIPPSESASIVFVDNYEYEEMYNKLIVLNPVPSDAFKTDPQQ